MIKFIVLKDLKRSDPGQFIFLQTFRVPVPYSSLEPAMPTLHLKPSLEDPEVPVSPASPAQDSACLLLPSLLRAAASRPAGQGA